MVVSTDLENRCLTLFIWHKIEIRDEVRVLTCSLRECMRTAQIGPDVRLGVCRRQHGLVGGKLDSQAQVPP